MKYLGVDYGKKKVGLAISEGALASPWQVLSANSLADAVEKISKIVTKEQITKVVVGVPESGEARRVARNFIARLKKVIAREIEVVEVEETLTSYEAREFMVELNLKRKSKQKEDAYAAAIILQRYLEEFRKNVG